MRKMYAEARRADRMAAAMDQYLKRRPLDWRGWVDMASIQLALNNKEAAVQALERSLRTGGNEARSQIEKDPRFRPMLEEALSRSQSLIGLPGLLPGSGGTRR
jgi:hypothetical protein